MLTACGGSSSIPSTGAPGPITPTGANTVPEVSTPGVPASSVASPATPTATPTPGYKTCVTTDPNQLCIGLKLVSYQDATGTPVLSKTQAAAMVEGMNTVWAQCNIGFQLEKYVSVDPTKNGLVFSPKWQTDAGTIRADFVENNTFLVVAVGPWSDATIAVTEMPGAGPFGTLVDAQYATNPLTVGHELGHYQGLYHITDNTNLMNPYIGPSTSTLTSAQCATARSTDLSNWQAMLRK